jgi:enoyl-CoA hydratase/carnithine racemase
MAGVVRVETEGALGWIVFDHLARRNAITAQMWAAIPAAARRLELDRAVRVVILRGAGEAAFLSGADISEFESMRSGPGAVAYDAQNTRAFEAIAGIGKPVLAMIHGFCMGGGTAIALEADRATRRRRGAAIPAAKLGLGYSPSGIDTLVRLVGPSVAKDLFFSARRVRAEEALRVGLVNAVVKADLESFGAGAERSPPTLRSHWPASNASCAGSRERRRRARTRRSPARCAPASRARTIGRACGRSSRSARRSFAVASD